MLSKIAIVTGIAGSAMLFASLTEARTYDHHPHRYAYRGAVARAPYATPRRLIPRDRVANPGRGNPNRTPQNATTQPF